MNALLTPDRLLVYPVVVIAVFGVVWTASLHSGAVLLPDLLARWSGGRLLVDGRAEVLYDPGVQSALQRVVVDAQRLSWFVSPPPVAVVFAPLGALAYPMAGLVWTVGSAALLAWTAIRAARLHPALEMLGTRRGMLVAASCQPVLELVGAGQDTALVLAALVGGASLLVEGREVLAGVVLAVGTVKPHLVLLVPVVLLLGRAWKALVALLAVTTAAVVATTAWLGIGVWYDWVAALTSPLYRTEVGEGQAWKNASLRGLLDTLGPGAAGPWVSGVWMVLVLVVLVLTAGWLRGQGVPLWAHLVVTVPLVTALVAPHVLVYDLVLVLPAATLLVARGGPTARAGVAVGYVLLFLAPLWHLVALRLPAVSVIGAPWVVLVVVGLWLSAVRPAGVLSRL
ncbi:DUF2029 domain-containing protein [Phycicoccus sp. CSK15P-2]|uniref:glycosyltransferase family 87 protein n=1 Tax=Phycicoccus sp. CSK15P-2 TaxID=2807627 RepID=UPI00194FCF2D|nr:glycosyltransferase family 87 protein [Phycicoccus sp. CSK15P-2]MBM6405970.1 DUF2029 domain-containing protein [Phycicoccus sp. CSK15P-2]